MLIYLTESDLRILHACLRDEISRQNSRAVHSKTAAIINPAAWEAQNKALALLKKLEN